jgi:CheY-like chemotaxis protein
LRTALAINQNASPSEALQHGQNPHITQESNVEWTDGSDGAEGAVTARRRLLIVEDSPTMRRVMRRFLDATGYEMLEAGDGEEALRVARAHPGPIHLLVTDVVMPRMGGRDLASALREARPEVPVLYISGYAEDAVRQHGVLDPDTAFLGKPFTADQLLTAVTKAVAGATT